eukprot:11771530-Ditylum_brightwellii.AAC.1
MKRKEKKRKEIEKANRGEESSDDSETATGKSDDDDNGYKDDETIASNVLVAKVVLKPLQIGQSGWSRKRAVQKVKPKDRQIVVQCLEE